MSEFKKSIGTINVQTVTEIFQKHIAGAGDICSLIATLATSAC
jgi:hypothetical protein